MAFSMAQLPRSDFLKNQFTKLLGPPLDVNRMWTKRNDHAPKRERTDFINIPSKRTILKKNQGLTILLSSLVFIFSSPKKFHQNFIITTKALKFYYSRMCLV